MTQFETPVIPSSLRNRRQWLVWRLVQSQDDQKPRKVPFYVNGNSRKAEQGTAEDIAQLATFVEAVDAVRTRGYSGLGFAILGGSGIVALDFDHCVRDGVIQDSRIEELVAGTYAEISPSGTGLRAFFAGDLRSRKDNAPKQKRVDKKAGAPRLDGKFDVEVFGNTGFVTITGNATGDTLLWGLQDTVAPLTQPVIDMYRERFGAAGLMEYYSGAAAAPAEDEDVLTALFGETVTKQAQQKDLDASQHATYPVARLQADDADLTALGPEKLGWTLEEAREYLFDCDASVSREEWLNALMAVHYEFDGSAEALDLVDEWSATGDSYAGRKDVEGRWRSFGRRSGGAPITGKWLLKWRREQVAIRQENGMREALEAMGKAIAEAPDALTLQTKVMPQVAQTLHDFKVLEIEAYALVSARMKTFGASVTKTEFKRLVQRQHVYQVPTHTPACTEFGNAQRLLRKHAGGIMYVPELEQWFVWTGIYWRKASGNRSEISMLARTVILELPNEAHLHEHKLEEFHAFCSMSQRAQMLKAMVSIAESDVSVRIPVSELDKHKHLLGVKNGVVDLRTGELIPPKPEYFITMVAGAAYTPGAKCPEYLKALSDAFYGDKEMMDYILRTMGYSLLADPRENALFIAYGGGANGKGTIIDTARKAVGEYARVVNPETILGDGRKGNTSAGGPREDLVRLRGARMLYISEPDEFSELKEGLVKSLTGGDTIIARGVNAKTSIEIEPTWTMFIPTNHKPTVRGDDNGIWRRIRLMPFARDLANDPAITYDKGLKDRIAQNELPGILYQLVQAAVRYQQSGLTTPRVIAEAGAAYREEQDLLAEWLNECCEEGDFTTSMHDLWDSWKRFAEGMGYMRYVPSVRSLGRRLDKKFTATRLGGVRVRVGIRVKPVKDLF